jgi:hypothetical protein
LGADSPDHALRRAVPAQEHRRLFVHGAGSSLRGQDARSGSARFHEPRSVHRQLPAAAGGRDGPRVLPAVWSLAKRAKGLCADARAGRDGLRDGRAVLRRACGGPWPEPDRGRLRRHGYRSLPLSSPVRSGSFIPSSLPQSTRWAKPESQASI